MSANTFGEVFRVTTFGESHGPAIGLVIEGCPSGLQLDTDAIYRELQRRRPGQSSLTSPRNEEDQPEIFSGVFEGRTTGAPIGMLIRSGDARPGDYSHLKDTFRPSHADYTYEVKYGLRDYRGGGRSSARETAARVAAGAVARQILAPLGVEIRAWVQQVGMVAVPVHYTSLDLSSVDSSPVRCPHTETAAAMQELIARVRDAQDTIGGRIRCVCRSVPAGWGEPVFDRLHAQLGKAMLSINAVKGFQIGSGFDSAGMLGSEHNDVFYKDDGGRIRTRTNFSGGVQGGISNGEDIWFDTAFKPVATLMQDQDSVDRDGNAVRLEGKGRHDPCVLPRAVPIVEAMAALVLADFYLRSRLTKL